MSRRMFLFSAVYPYNMYGDNFLEREVDYLSKEFDSIIVIPYRKEIDHVKSIPSNCEVMQPILNNSLSFSLRGFFSLKGMRLLFPVFFKEKVYLNKTKVNTWIKAYTFLNNLCNRRDIREIGHQLNNNDVCYFYWGKWGNMLSVVWKGKAHFISRFHGEWDLWEESSGGYTPLRVKVAESLDFAAFISRKGEKYFHERYPVAKTIFAPLGSNDMGTSLKSTDGIVRIFTCSNVVALKRVPLIFECVNKFAYDKKVEWTHIGGGDGLAELELLIKEKQSKNLTVNLMGKQDHSKVIDYYQNNNIDLFLNLSTTEGVPVSIMEAISCDIPVVATDVGGVSEIVNKKTGVLVSSNPTVEEVVTAMVKALAADNEPREFWKQNYNADTNYSKFVNEIKKLTI